jgi:hypothetical protein
MYNKCTIILVCFLSSIMINSCNPILPLTDDLNSSPTAFTNSSTVPSPTISSNPFDTAYLDWLNKYPNLMGQPLNTFSPDGLKVVSIPGPFELAKDHIEVSFENNRDKKIEIPINNNLLGLPVTVFNGGKIYLSGGSYSSDSRTWSPDSTAFLAMGPARKGKPYTFLLIFDISDPNNIKQTTVEWDYEGDPYLAWMPDSSGLLIWFAPYISVGKTDNFSYTERAWIVDRQGNILKELDVKGFRSPIWVDNSLYVLKDEKEIWKIDIVQNHTEKLYTSEKPIKKLLDRNPTNSQLLLIESEAPFDLLIFDINTNQIVDRISSMIKMTPGQVEFCRSVRTTSHYTGLDTVGFYIFDWVTHKIKKSNDSIVTPFWSPVVNGFVVNGIDSNMLFIIYP